MPKPSHKSLIQCMQKLGHKIESEGVCFGVAHMGMQAILAKDIDTFDSRLEVIAGIEEDKIADKTKRSYQEKTNNLIQEIPAFFEGVALYHQPHLYPYLFKPGKAPTNQQQTMLVSPQVLSKALEKKGGICRAFIFSGMYTEGELKNYFDILVSVLLQNKKENNKK